MPSRATDRSAGDARRPGLRRGEHAGAIKAAALRLLEAQTDFTTKEVAREAEVAVRTFYHHFPSKDALLVALLSDLMRGYVDALEPRALRHTDPVERLRFVVTAPFRIMPRARAAVGPAFVTSQHWRLQRVDPEGVARAIAPYQELIRRTIEDGADAGLVTPRDADTDAWLIMQMVLAVYHHTAFDPGGRDETEVADDLWAFCADSLGVPSTDGARPLREAPK